MVLYEGLFVSPKPLVLANYLSLAKRLLQDDADYACIIFICCFDFPDLNFLCQSALKLEENVLSGERERIGTIKLAGSGNANTCWCFFFLLLG